MFAEAKLDAAHGLNMRRCSVLLPLPIRYPWRVGTVHETGAPQCMITAISHSIPCHPTLRFSGP